VIICVLLKKKNEMTIFFTDLWFWMFSSFPNDYFWISRFASLPGSTKKCPPSNWSSMHAAYRSIQSGDFKGMGSLRPIDFMDECNGICCIFTSYCK